MSLLVEGVRAHRGGFLLSAERLEIAPGSVASLMGRSGSGKSTFVDALAGFLPLDAGRILVGGCPVGALPPEKRRIAVVFQRSALFAHLSVVDNLAFALRVRGVARREREETARRWLPRLGIEGLGARRPEQLSGGQAQRVAVGRALVAGFPVLLLDEPFTGLDDEARDSIRSLVRRLVDEERVCALLVTHDRRDAEAIGDTHYLLDAGRLLPA